MTSMTAPAARIPAQRTSAENDLTSVFGRMTHQAVPGYRTDDTHLSLFRVGHGLGESFVWAKKCCAGVQLATYRPDRTATMTDTEFAAITLGFEVGVADARVRYGITEVGAR